MLKEILKEILKDQLQIQELSKVYINLIDQKEPKLNFSNERNENNLKVDTNNFYYKKIVKISDKVKKDHMEYLKNNLKKNFFN